MNMNKNLGVILLNWNNEENIIIHVTNLTQWNTPPSIIIVDNASDKDISSLIPATTPDLRIIKSCVNRGFSGGNNLGFQAFLQDRTEYILLLNHDANISEDIVTTLLDTINKNPDIGAIGPRTNEEGTWFAGGRNIAHHPVTRILYQPSCPLLQNVDYLPGAVCIIRGSALEKAGVFDEQFFFSGEMADLCQRIKVIGYECVVHTGVGITHNIGENSPMRERIHLYYSLRNRFLYIRKHERHFLFWTLFWVFFSLFLSTGVLIKRKPHSARAAFLAVRDGLMGRFGDHNEYFIH